MDLYSIIVKREPTREQEYMFICIIINLICRVVHIKFVKHIFHKTKVPFSTGKNKYFYYMSVSNGGRMHVL